VHDKALVLFEPNFRRNFLHVEDAAWLITEAIEALGSAGSDYVSVAFNKTPFRVFNAGLSSANLTKAQLCDRIAKYVPGFIYTTAAIGKDPDQRDYVVSNARLEGIGWKPSISLDSGIEELVRGYAMPLGSPYRNI
jgi:nucleoside-diphosphate-sugar epimerase